MPHTPRTPIKITGAILGLTVPALLIAAVWLWDWRWVATAAIAGLTALTLAGAATSPTKTRPLATRERL